MLHSEGHLDMPHLCQWFRSDSRVIDRIVFLFINVTDQCSENARKE